MKTLVIDYNNGDSGIFTISEDITITKDFLVFVDENESGLVRINMSYIFKITEYNMTNQDYINKQKRKAERTG